jgi:hypothetical protein
LQVGEEAATVTRRPGRPARGGSRLGPQGRYGLLLILLILTYLMSAFSKGDWVGTVQLGLFVLTGLLALRSSRLPRRRVQVISVIGLTGSAVAAGLAISRPNDAAVAAASIWTGVLLLATVAIIVRRILSFATVTEQSIYGAVSAYLILGLMFAAFYAAISLLNAGHFFADHQPGNSRTYQYFSFTTLTTLGYGDFTAAGHGGQAVAVIEALTGQVFLATLVARLVAGFRGPTAPPAAPRSARRPSGPPPPPESRPARPRPPGQPPARQPPARQLPASMRPGHQPRRPPRPAARSSRPRPPPGTPDR